MSNGNTSNDSSERQQQLDELIAQYVTAVESGAALDQDELLANNPEFADELREFFQYRDQMENLVKPLRSVAQALHVRCPHCHNPIELLDEAPLEEINCPSCGSSFSLVGDRTLSHDPTTKSFGHFELLDRVGIGQFGSVWKARDTKLDRTVAVKIPRNGRLDSAQTEMFLRDARAAAQLKHPNIVSVHEVGKQDETIYIVSDFIQGATLKEWMKAKRLSPRESAELCVKIAKALHHAHEAGVIHRDLKPGNIMMDTDGEPHIVDFGLAKREAGEITMTVEGQILGTPAYMSPEQARGEGHTVDRRADIYSIGVILFEMLTGELPFRGDKQMLLVQILKDDPPSARKLNSSVPRDLETICLKSLEKEPGKRYTTASEFADDLERWIDGRPIVARRSRSLERVVKWTRRHPARAALAVASVVALCTAVGIVLSLAYSARLEVAYGKVEHALSRESSLRKQREEALDEANILRVEATKHADAAELARKGESEQRRSAEAQRTVATNQALAANLARRNENVQRLRAESALRTSDELLYLLRIMSAVRAWKDNNVQRVEELLNECPAELRNLEWHYLKRQCQSELLTLNFDAAVRSIAISPDAKLICVVTSDRKLFLYDRIGNRDERLSVEEATCAEFSPDGRHMMVGRNDGTLDLLELTNGKLVSTFMLEKQLLKYSDATAPFTCAIHRIAFSPDGDKFGAIYRISHYRKGGAVFSPGPEGAVWKLTDPSAIIGLREWVTCIAFNPNGDRLAVGSGYAGRSSGILKFSHGGLSVWDLSTQKRTNVTDDLGANVNEVFGVAFSPDGRQVVTGHGNSSVRTWNADTLKKDVAIYDHKGPVWDVAITDDLIISCGSDQTIRGFNLQGTEVIRLRGHKQAVRQLKISKDNRTLVTSCEDNTVKLWNLKGQSKQEVFDMQRQLPFIDIAFSPDEKQVVCTSRGGDLHFVDLDKRKEIKKIECRGVSLALSPNGKLLVTGGSSSDLTLWQWPGGKEIHRFKIEKTRTHGSRVAFSPDNNFVAMATRDGITVWNVTTKEVFRTYTVESGETIWDVVFSPNGQLLAYAIGKQGQVVILSRESGQIVSTLKGHTQTIWDIEFSPDSKTVASGSGVHNGGEHPGELKLWDVATGKLMHDLKGHPFGVWSVAFSPDGKRLASGAGAWVPGPNVGGEIKIWDSKHGHELLTLDDHSGAIMSLAFSRDGRNIVTASADLTVRILRTK